jgi:hypothetical protein
MFKLSPRKFTTLVNPSIIEEQNPASNLIVDQTSTVPCRLLIECTLKTSISGSHSPTSPTPTENHLDNHYASSGGSETTDQDSTPTPSAFLDNTDPSDPPPPPPTLPATQVSETSTSATISTVSTERDLRYSTPSLSHISGEFESRDDLRSDLNLPPVTVTDEDLTPTPSMAQLPDGEIPSPLPLTGRVAIPVVAPTFALGGFPFTFNVPQQASNKGRLATTKNAASTFSFNRTSSQLTGKPSVKIFLPASSPRVSKILNQWYHFLRKGPPDEAVYHYMNHPYQNSVCPQLLLRNHGLFPSFRSKLTRGSGYLETEKARPRTTFFFNFPYLS